MPSTTTPPILLEIRDAIARITLNRPEQANVLNDDTGQAFIGVVRPVVLRQLAEGLAAIRRKTRAALVCTLKARARLCLR